MIGGICVLQPRDLVHDVLGRSRGVPLPVNWFRAPVAVIGTAASRGDVHREVAVPLHPERAVPWHIDEVPRRAGQSVEIPDKFTCRRADGSLGRGSSTHIVPVGRIVYCEEAFTASGANPPARHPIKWRLDPTRYSM